VKIVCAWCGAGMGEKCPTCGQPAVMETPHPERPREAIFGCSLAHAWLRGEGGTTDSICQECKEEHFPVTRSAVTASPAQ